MKTFTTTLICACFALAAGAASAQDAVKKADGMPKDGMKKEMSLQDCKDQMAMAKKDGMKKDDAMMKQEAICADLMKKEGATGEPMKK
jgi:pentapeptide MXKDX repeat protein